MSRPLPLHLSESVLSESVLSKSIPLLPSRFLSFRSRFFTFPSRSFPSRFLPFRDDVSAFRVDSSPFRVDSSPFLVGTFRVGAFRVDSPFPSRFLFSKSIPPFRVGPLPVSWGLEGPVAPGPLLRGPRRSPTRRPLSPTTGAAPQGVPCQPRGARRGAGRARWGPCLARPLSRQAPVSR